MVLPPPPTGFQQVLISLVVIGDLAQKKHVFEDGCQCFHIIYRAMTYLKTMLPESTAYIRLLKTYDAVSVCQVTSQCVFPGGGKVPQEKEYWGK